MTTRWSSEWSDPQWMQIDLGRSVDISRVVIYWEYASGKDYSIQVSDDGSRWRTIYSRDNRVQFGGRDDLLVEGKGRFLRIYLSERATPYGYSIYELEVYQKSLLLKKSHMTTMPPGLTICARMGNEADMGMYW